MKKPEIKECNLSNLIQRSQKEFLASRFFVPSYQRGYSWDTKNWKWFLQSVEKLIERNKHLKEKEEKDIWFIGNVILQKEGVNNYSIIDGQQRLVTIFILLSIIYAKIFQKHFDNDKDQIIKSEIEFFLFSDWQKGQLRIELSELDNPVDKENFESNVLVNCQSRFYDYPPEGRDNISKANRFFANKINTRNYYDIYQTVVNDFYFSLMIMDKEADAGELFMALNKTALDLTIADLVKSLFVTRATSQLVRQEISRKWNEKIVKKVCVFPENSSNHKKSQEILDFLITFREARFGETYKYAWRQSNELYEFFEDKIEESENDQLLDQMIEYAEVYHRVKHVLDNASWWENQWPFEIVYLISDFLLLDYFWLLSLTLAAYFQFKGKNEVEKEIIIRELKKLLTFAFRVLTVKDKSWEKKFFWEIWGNSLKKLARKNDDNFTTLISSNLGPISWFFKEFEPKNSLKFYEEELKGWKPEKRNEEKIWKFIFRTYYWKKISVKNDINEDEKKQMKKEMLRYEIGYLEAFEEDETENEKFKNDLGNITLLRKDEVENKKFSKKWDQEKREFLKELRKDCLMNYLEEEDWIEISSIRDLTEKRKNILWRTLKDSEFSNLIKITTFYFRVS